MIRQKICRPGRKKANWSLRKLEQNKGTSLEKQKDGTKEMPLKTYILDNSIFFILKEQFWCIKYLFTFWVYMPYTFLTIIKHIYWIIMYQLYWLIRINGIPLCYLSFPFYIPTLPKGLFVFRVSLWNATMESNDFHFWSENAKRASRSISIMLRIQIST